MGNYHCPDSNDCSIVYFHALRALVFKIHVITDKNPTINFNAAQAMQKWS